MDRDKGEGVQSAGALYVFMASSLAVLLAFCLSAPAGFGAQAKLPAKAQKPDSEQAASLKDSRTQQAYAYMKRGWVLRAIDLFQRIVRQHPDDLSARVGLGLAEEKQGRVERAITAYEGALAIDPNELTALGRLGILYSWRKETWPRAIDRLSTLLAIKPDDRGARRMLGDLYAWNGRFAEAEQEYRTLLAGGDNDTSLPVVLAEALTWQGRGAEALPIFETARANGVTFDEMSRYALALAYFQARRYSDAENAYLQLTRDYPANEKYRDELAKVRDEIAAARRYEVDMLLKTARQRFTAGDRDGAFSGFERALALNDDPAVRLEYADLLASVPERREEALRQLDLVRPRTDAVDRARARILASFPERRDEAYALYAKLRVKYPEDPALQRELIDLLSWIELDDSKALVAAEMLARSPDAARLRPTLARYYEKRGRPADAIPLLETMVRDNGNDVGLRLRLADAYTALGRLDDARTQIQAALALEPNNAEANEQAGWIALEDGSPRRALVQFNAASAVRPEARGPRLGRINALLALDRPLAALNTLRALDTTTDPAIRDAQARVERAVAEITGNDGVQLSFETTARSGEEAATVTAAGERSTGALTTFRTALQASAQLAPRIGLAAEGAAVNLDGHDLGSISGFEGRIRITLVPSDTFRATFAAGATLVGEPTFLGRIDARSGDRIRFFVEGSRLPVVESLLAYAGVRDRSTGRIVGRVMASGAGGGVTIKVGDAFDLHLHGRIDRLTADGLASNTRGELVLNLGRELHRDFEALKRFTYFRPSFQVAALAFDKDANTVTLRDADGNPLLVRGYFSPSSFVAPGARLDFGWQALNERLEAAVGTGLSAHISRGEMSRFFSQETTLGFDLSTALRYSITQRIAWNLFYAFSNSGVSFRENRIAFSLTFDLR